MTKKQQAHSGEKGIMDTARGYAMKAKPGPGSHTGQRGKVICCMVSVSVIQYNGIIIINSKIFNKFKFVCSYIKFQKVTTF